MANARFNETAQFHFAQKLSVKLLTADIGLLQVVEQTLMAQTPTQYVEQVAAITQQGHGNGGDVFEVDCIGQLYVSVCQGFHQLGCGQYSGGRIGMEDIDRGVAVNQ